MPNGQVIATIPDTLAQALAWLTDKGYDVATIPQYAVATFDALIEWCGEQGIHFITAKKDVIVGIAEDVAMNAGENTNLIPQGITALVPVTGGANITKGKTFFGTIAKKIAAGAMIASLGVSMTAAQIKEAVERFATDSLEDWTIDGAEDQIAVLVDDNGNTFLDSRMIEDFRAKLVEYGVFRNQQYFPVYPSDDDITISSVQSLMSLYNYAMSYTPLSFSFDNAQDWVDLHSFIALYEDYPATISVLADRKSVV